MESVDLHDAADEIRRLSDDTDSEADRTLLRRVGDTISVGDISGSTGIAIGREIRQVINRFELSPAAVAALLDLRTDLGRSFGTGNPRYRLGAVLAEKTRRFVGREHIFQAIDRFTTTHSNGYFLVHGPPGVGKSALIAEYVRRSGCLVHVNSRGLGITSAAQFIENICAQIIADAALPHTSLPPGATTDGAFLLQVLAEARHGASADEPLVIAVDALDEVAANDRPDGANILFLPTVLPDGVYFVMTRRDTEVSLVAQAPIGTLSIGDYPTENSSDVQRYIRNALERPRLRAWVSARSLDDRNVVAALAELSESNFMYLFHMLPEIESGAYRDLDIEQLPVGLVGYYEDHWVRMGMTVKPLPRVKLRLIYLLSEARKPISRQLLSEFASDATLRADEVDVQEVLDEWRQFLLEERLEDQQRHSLYHTSFRDFLHRKDIVRAAGVTIEGIHKLIADNLWTSVFEA